MGSAGSPGRLLSKAGSLFLPSLTAAGGAGFHHLRCPPAGALRLAAGAGAFCRCCCRWSASDAAATNAAAVNSYAATAAATAQPRLPMLVRTAANCSPPVLPSTFQVRSFFEANPVYLLAALVGLLCLPVSALILRTSGKAAQVRGGALGRCGWPGHGGLSCRQSRLGRSGVIGAGVMSGCGRIRRLSTAAISQGRQLQLPSPSYPPVIPVCSPPWARPRSATSPAQTTSPPPRRQVHARRLRRRRVRAALCVL